MAPRRSWRLKFFGAVSMDWKQLLAGMNERLIWACKTLEFFSFSAAGSSFSSLQHELYTTHAMLAVIMCLESYYSSYVGIYIVTF